MADARKIGVAVIHGIGDQKPPVHPGQRGFSDDLYDRLRRSLGAGGMADVAWKEVYWSDVFQPRQQAYLDRMYGGGAREFFPVARRFVLYNLADASGYLDTALRDPNDMNNAYRQVQSKVAAALADLETRVVPGAPLLVLAHSMGGQIMTNYFYDTWADGQGGRPLSRNHIAVSDFQACQTLRGFVTFGCNIPVFVLSLGDANIQEVQNPGPPTEPGTPWWTNFYDKSDVLGFPLKEVSTSYRRMVAEGKLRDIEVNAGGLFASWNPWSHNGYWRHRAVVDTVARLLQASRG